MILFYFVFDFNYVRATKVDETSSLEIKLDKILKPPAKAY